MNAILTAAGKILGEVREFDAILGVIPGTWINSIESFVAETVGVVAVRRGGFRCACCRRFVDRTAPDGARRSVVYFVRVPFGTRAGVAFYDLVEVASLYVGPHVKWCIECVVTRTTGFDGALAASEAIDRAVVTPLIEEMITGIKRSGQVNIQMRFV